MSNPVLGWRAFRRIEIRMNHSNCFIFHKPSLDPFLQLWLKAPDAMQ